MDVSLVAEVLPLNYTRIFNITFLIFRAPNNMPLPLLAYSAMFMRRGNSMPIVGDLIM